METEVRCSGCHRVERWGADGTVEVVVPGGQRRPEGSAQAARGHAAVRVARSDALEVVGVCSACGQFMVGPVGAVPAMPVRIDTPQGPLVWEGRVLTGPSGALSPDEAEVFLTQAYPNRWIREWAGQLFLAPYFFVLVPLLVGWVMAALFVLSFLASVAQGPVSPVSP